MFLAQFNKALSEPTRLRILALILEYKQVCVCDLVSVLAMPQGSISRHLSYLKKSGLVESHTRGTWRVYQINTELDDSYQTIIDQTLLVLKHDLQVQQDISTFNRSNC
jgi:ArsR family transcriptional regulator